MTRSLARRIVAPMTTTNETRTDDLPGLLGRNTQGIATRTDKGRERASIAAAYAWGREDMGDHKPAEWLARIDGASNVTPSFAFAQWAADRADAYDRGERTSLPSVPSEYATWLGMLPEHANTYLGTLSR